MGVFIRFSTVFFFTAILGSFASGSSNSGISWDSPELLNARKLVATKDWEKAASQYITLIDKTPYDLNLVREARIPLLIAGRRKELAFRLIQSGKSAGLSFEMGSGGWKELFEIGRTFIKTSEQEHYLNGLSDLMAGRADDAVTRFSEVEKMDSGQVENLIRRGQAYFILGKLKQSESDFTEALRFLPNEPEALTWLGRISQVQGAFTKAEEQFMGALRARQKKQKLLGEKERSQRFQIWYSELLAQTKRNIEAKKFLEEFTHEEPAAVPALLTLAKIYIQSQPLRHTDLWLARKALQIGLSRMQDESNEWKHSAVKLESEWGLVVLQDKALKEEVQVLLTELDLRLKNGQPIRRR